MLQAAGASGGSGVKMGQALKVTRAIRRHIKEDCSPRMVELFLEIGMQSKVSLNELGKRTNTPQPAVSRLVQALAEGRPAHGEPGLGLVERFDDEFDARNKMAQLTPKGRAALSAMLKEI